MGTMQLAQYQVGLESTRGTAVAATRVLGASPKAVPMDRIWTPYRLGVGRRSEFTTKQNYQYLVRDTLTFDDAHPLAFQNLPLFHQCSLDGAITPAEVTPAQSDYRWDVAPTLTGTNSPKTFTLEMGDDVEQYKIEYCMVDNLKIGGQIPADGSAAPVTG